MEQHLETIGAFFDGERVDAAALHAALATEEGRAYLVELAAMREIVAMPAVAGAPVARSSARSMKWLLAAAALIVVVGAAGFVMGRADVERRVAIERAEANRAPAPTREVPGEAGVSWSSSTGSN